MCAGVAVGGGVQPGCLCDVPAVYQLRSAQRDPPLGSPLSTLAAFAASGAMEGTEAAVKDVCADCGVACMGPRGSRAFAWATSRVSEQGRGPATGTLLTCPARCPRPSSVSLGSMQPRCVLTQTLTGAEFLRLAARATGSSQPPRACGLWPCAPTSGITGLIQKLPQSRAIREKPVAPPLGVVCGQESPGCDT